MSRRAGLPQARLVQGPRMGPLGALGDRPMYSSDEELK